MSVRPDITTLSIEMANLSMTKYPTNLESSPEAIGDCPICYDKMSQPRNNIRIEHCCKHTFHRACLQTWANEQRSMKRKCTCPMCRDQSPVEFIEQLFEGCKKDVISLHYECSCNKYTDVDFLSPNMLQGLSESQKNGLRDIIKRIQRYHEDRTQPLLIVFVMCPEHPLNIDPEESSADRQYEVMEMLLEWGLDHVSRQKRPTSHSKFGLFPRRLNYDYFGHDPFLDGLF
ncbi:hypothetical protein EAF00_003825 [Botryotinia globosa]|nr:hypothetical protein EAF00_003825 [Botryotinia globosa]